MSSTIASSTPFDPDSSAEQSEQALSALIEEIEQQMQRLQLPCFNQSNALDLGLTLVKVGTARNLPIAIDIRRASHVLFHASLPGATADNDSWVARKSRTAARYQEPSLLVGLRARAGGGRMEDNAWFDQSRFSAHGGAWPIFVRGTGCVATVTVSGLPQKADHDLLVEVLSSFIQTIPGIQS